MTKYTRTVFVEDGEFAVLVANKYGDTSPRVVPLYQSDRPEKQRAELMRLLATLLDHCEADGITIEVGEGGKVNVRG